MVWFILWWVIGFLLIDWKRWRLGYTTALAGSLGSFLLDTAFVSGGFWSYTDGFLPGLWPNIALNLGIYPVGAWIFVQRLPSGRGRRWLWILLGTVILLAVEYNLRALGRMSYHNGWHIGWSALANLFLLRFLVFHFRKVERPLHP